MIDVTFSAAAIMHIARTGATPFDLVGFVFDGLSETNPAGAVEQLDRSYAHGGGWRPLKGFSYANERLSYAGDPDMMLIATVKLRDETIMLFESAWVCVLQLDGSIEVARMD